MRFNLSLSLTVALAAAAACGGGGGGSDLTPTIPSTPNNPVATTSVSLENNRFNPANIVVPPSAVVTFTNADGISHNVIFANQGITSIDFWTTGNRTATMPAAAATYGYTCTIHPGMNGSVKVQ